MKKIVLYISFIYLSSCVPYVALRGNLANYPEENYQMNDYSDTNYQAVQNDLTSEIRYYENLLQEEQRKKYMNYGWDRNAEEYYKIHLRNLYLQRSYNEYCSRYTY